MNIDPTALSVAAALLALCAALLFARRARYFERVLEATEHACRSGWRRVYELRNKLSETEWTLDETRRRLEVADKALVLAEREINILNRERDEARELVASLSGMVPDLKPGDAE